MEKNPLTGELERSLAGGVDGMASCGAGTFILFLMLVLSIVLIVYLTKRNTDTVRIVLNALTNEEEPDEKNPAKD